MQEHMTSAIPTMDHINQAGLLTINRNENN